MSIGKKLDLEMNESVKIENWSRSKWLREYTKQIKPGNIIYL